MPKTNIDYSNTIIYKISCKDASVNHVYVGHTTNFVQRKYVHKTGSMNKNAELYEIIREHGGWENWNMEIVTFLHCDNHNDAIQREQEYRILLKATIHNSGLLPLSCNQPTSLPFVSKDKQGKHNNDVTTTISKHQQSYICCYCMTSYKYHSGLWRHKSICTYKNNESNPNITLNIISDDETEDWEYNEANELDIDASQQKNIIIHNSLNKKATKQINNLTAENREMKMNMKIMMEMMRNNTQFQSQILETIRTSTLMLSNPGLGPGPAQVPSSSPGADSCPGSGHSPGPGPGPGPYSASIFSGDNSTINSNNTTTISNNTNNTFNMNMFLNEKCKDAMNMKDFVNSIQLNMTDMENMDRLGYVEGMSTIFIDNLNKTDVYKRPVHCSDMKRETLYVKENDQWEREGPDHAKMTKAVLAVEHKNVVLVNEWANANPRCLNSNTRENEKYFRLSTIVTDGDKHGNIDKVIRKVAKCVPVEKEQHKAN